MEAKQRVATRHAIYENFLLLAVREIALLLSWTGLLRSCQAVLGIRFRISGGRDDCLNHGMIDFEWTTKSISSLVRVFLGCPGISKGKEVTRWPRRDYAALQGAARLLTLQTRTAKAFRSTALQEPD